MLIKKDTGTVVRWLSSILIVASLNITVCAMENQFDEDVTNLLFFNLIHNKCTPEKVAYFIAQKANINGEDTYGNTPLLTALRFGCSREVVRALVLHGADINKGRPVDKVNHGLFLGRLGQLQVSYLQVKPNDPDKVQLMKSLIEMLIAVGQTPKDIAVIRGWNLEAMKYQSEQK